MNARQCAPGHPHPGCPGHGPSSSQTSQEQVNIPILSASQDRGHACFTLGREYTPQTPISLDRTKFPKHGALWDRAKPPQSPLGWEPSLPHLGLFRTGSGPHPRLPENKTEYSSPRALQGQGHRLLTSCFQRIGPSPYTPNSQR